MPWFGFGDDERGMQMNSNVAMKDEADKLKLKNSACYL